MNWRTGSLTAIRFCHSDPSHRRHHQVFGIIGIKGSRLQGAGIDLRTLTETHNVRMPECGPVDRVDNLQERNFGYGHAQ
jgi:hypothetical protein